MKKREILFIIMFFLIISVSGQKPTLELAFTAIDSTDYIQLDSIKVMNRSQGGDTVLYYPDTILVLDYQTGINEFCESTYKLQVFQNFPNPVESQTTVSIFVPEKDRVIIEVTDILGRLILKSARIMDKGFHSFQYSPGQGNINIFSAHWRGSSSSIKIIKTSSCSNREASIEYLGNRNSSLQLKTSGDIQNLPFSYGDTMLYIGYADTLQSGWIDIPENSKTHTFIFATNIPCPSTPTVEYEGQVYNTIQVYNQCWLKENLNVGLMIQGVNTMTDNGILEKYCYNNEPDSCIKYGGLYQWWEMMQYSTQQGVKGICPNGWHLPTDEEWKVLEGAVDSQYSIGDTIWDKKMFRGFDVGTNLKTTTGWYLGGNGIDLFDFSCQPGGYRNYAGLFGFGGPAGLWWTSNETEYNIERSWGRTLYYGLPETSRGTHGKEVGFSVRCLRDF